MNKNLRIYLSSSLVAFTFLVPQNLWGMEKSLKELYPSSTHTGEILTDGLQDTPLLPHQGLSELKDKIEEAMLKVSKIVNAPRGKPRGITVDLKVEYKLRLPRIFLPLTFYVLLNNFLVNSNCRYKISI